MIFFFQKTPYLYLWGEEVLADHPFLLQPPLPLYGNIFPVGWRSLKTRN